MDPTNGIAASAEQARAAKQPQRGRPTAARRTSNAQGIALRHSRGCESREGRSCSCTPRYQAQAWSARARKPIRKTFPTLAGARAWRQETQVALRRGKIGAPSALTVRDAAEAWLKAADSGVVRTRSGEPYKPSALRSYGEALNSKVLPEFGHRRLSSLGRSDLQDFVDHLVAKGLAPNSVRNALLPLRAIYRRALARQEASFNPTLELELPAARARRERVARPREAAALVTSLPESERALWATALYAGLRRGELQGLRWSDVDLNDRLIRVERGWDRKAGPVEPKSRSGRRRVPITDTLRAHLLAHRLRQGRGGEGLVFSATSALPFDPPTASRSAKAAWREAGLKPIALHECRHTYASFMIAAGVNAKALSVYMGHSSVTVTLDRYGHLMPGNEREAAILLESYLNAAA